MSSLWTPEGEHRVPRDRGEPDLGTTVDAEPVTAGETNRSTGITAEEERQYRQQMAELERELLEAPVEAVVANHCYGLFQLAAMHLGQTPPNLDAARLSIDALGAIVDNLGDRLGDAAPTLKEGLAQLRLAFVQIAGARTGTGEAAPGSSGPATGEETTPHLRSDPEPAS